MKRLLILSLVGAVAAVTLGAGWFALSMRGGTEPWSPPIGAAPPRAAVGRAPCADRAPLRRAWFGDLHVHTAYSWDGAGRGLRTTPDQAYRFARGEPLGLPPYGEDGRGLRTARLDRPLDFAAVTDHAEWIGEVALCIQPDRPVFDSARCRSFRREASYLGLPRQIAGMVALRGGSRGDLCGDGRRDCREALLSAWRETGEAAERWYDRTSACRFTTFHAYEYTWAPAANRVHRNVIFRNEVVPELPISAVDEPEPEGLWRRLRALCLDGEGDCDVLAIPHNPNHSSGRMFSASDPSEPLDARRARAKLRADMEPLVEMMQIKGESECRNGLAGVVGEPDELCGLEKYAPPDASDCGVGGVGWGKSLGLGCVSRTDYARYTVAAGLAEEAALGVNPFRVGFIGSTDTHNGTPGDVEEWSFDGSRGETDADPVRRLDGAGNRNPGGLVGVWAEENTRDALFEAMRRRETFATSGPRMTVRLFAGWGDFRADGGSGWCERPDAIAAGYADGVPMGGVLSAADASYGHGAPRLAVLANRDAGTLEHPGGLLERVQIVKVQVDPDGAFRQTIFDVAGGPTGAGVDLASCTPRGPGADQLCAVWTDPAFDAAVPAAYYARVVENPSCRWTTWHCLAMNGAERPPVCDDPDEPRTTRERAWSSPIWFRPAS